MRIFIKQTFLMSGTGIMAGSPCPVKVMQDVVDKMNMSEITIVYGQTESSPVVLKAGWMIALSSE